MKYTSELHERVRQNLRMFDYPRFDDGDIDALLDEIEHLNAELARRDEIIARLKEDGERMANSDYRLPSGVTKCPYCSKADWTIRPDGKSTEIHHSPDCPITLHRALIAELEKETEK